MLFDNWMERVSHLHDKEIQPTSSMCEKFYIPYLRNSEAWGSFVLEMMLFVSVTGTEPRTPYTLGKCSTVVCISIHEGLFLLCFLSPQNKNETWTKKFRLWQIGLNSLCRSGISWALSDFEKKNQVVSMENQASMAFMLYFQPTCKNRERWDHGHWNLQWRYLWRPSAIIWRRDRILGGRGRAASLQTQS